MAQQSNDLRERLLAALPQPENRAAYREETAALLAKHARALRADRITSAAFGFIFVGVTFLWSGVLWLPPTLALHGLQAGSALFFFMSMVYFLRHEIYAIQIGTLKEIKQVQLQILELQASLRKEH